MSWLKSFAHGSFSLFAGNSVDAFQPLDFYHFYPLWYDLWIDRIDEALTQLNADEKTFQELHHLLPVPSNIRAILQKIVPSYRGFVRKNPEQTKRVTEFFARMLSESCPTDPFGESSTPLHSDEEVKAILEQTEWQDGTPEHARMLGKLLTASASLVHGLYNDLVTDFGWDAYGPYRAIKDGKEHTLLIRHFPDLRPSDLWSSEFLAPVRELKIIALYEDVKWRIACVGCHTLLESGNPITGLREFAVEADGRVVSPSEIQSLIETIAVRAESLYRSIREKPFEEIKKMVILQECYQTKKLFEAAGMNWLPTDEMLIRVKDKPLLSGLVPEGKIMTSVEQYEREFGFHEFSHEVLKQELSSTDI